MRRGGKPQAEFIGGLARVRPRQPESARPIKAPIQKHIDLRVIRKVDYEFSDDTPEWDYFLNTFGANHRAKGKTEALGAMAMCYIPSKHLGSMLREKFPDNYHDPKKKVLLFRKVNAHINGYLEDQRRGQFDMCLVNLAADRARQKFEQEQLLDEPGEERLSSPISDTLSVQEKLRLSEHTFGPATFAIGGIGLYGNNRYALDLASSERAVQERQALVDHLRSQRLPVAILDADWSPHVTFFKTHDHIKTFEPDYDPNNLPSKLKFCAPQTEHDGL